MLLSVLLHSVKVNPSGLSRKEQFFLFTALQVIFKETVVRLAIDIVNIAAKTAFA